MESGFWLERWQRGEIGFHRHQVHPLLQAYLPQLALQEGAHVFVPLCGKSLDIGYLLEQELAVTGVELSELAVRELFDVLSLSPDVTDWRAGRCWRGGQLTIFQGDYFALRAADIGAVDAVYDRAALVAMPDELRHDYAGHLLEITYAAPQLLVSFEYRQAQMAGPPFSVATPELMQLYGDCLELRELARTDIIAAEPRFRDRGLEQLDEVAWHLVPVVDRPA